MLEMCKIDLRELNWRTPDDWSTLIPTASSYTGQPRICKEDVLRFFDYIIREVAREANLSFDEAKKVIWEENSAFLSYVDAIFNEEEVYKENAEKIKNLHRLLIIPYVPLTVGSVVSLYNRLASDKRKEVREYIAKIDGRS